MRSLFSVILLLVPVLYLLSPVACFAKEPETVITSDSLEYFTEAKKYIAKGSVKIEREGSSVKADEITYYEGTSDVLAEGNVRYEDEKISMKAGRAELNIDDKTGKLYDAEVFYKKDNYYLNGKEIEKRGENYYYSPEASFTTCDAPLPAWCFKGKKIDAVIGERVKARDVSFRIKGLPVFYAPYFWAPIITERQTGFLIPVVSYYKKRGLSMKLPYFWAISENRDATFVLDLYSRRGIGAGLEYRFIKPGGVKSNWWAYHIRDTELNKDFWEFRALHENRREGSPGGFLNINLVNEKDFYREFNPYLDVRTQRFLESTMELEAPYGNSRLYLLSQYWQDLKYDTGDAPRRLPEIGCVLNYSRVGNFMFSSSLTAANIWRKDGVSAGRIDIYPNLLHSFGKDFVITQKAALRGTGYYFYQRENIDDRAGRIAFEYEITGRTRLYRRYSSFTHVIEPSARYHFISSSENNLPLLDSSELYKRTSKIELGILNRVIAGNEELLSLRLSQGVDTYKGDRPFLPFKLELSMRKPLSLKMEATYDVHKGRLETVTSDMSFHISNATLSLGQRYNRQEDIMLYKTQVEFSPARYLKMAGRLWYDAKGRGLRDMTLSLMYLRQCWGIKFEVIKRPGDYTVMVMFELTKLVSNLSE
ncbi:MAG: LPS assembly protein LptD [Nitrospirota bacterium]